MSEDRRIDEWGRVIVNPEAAFRLLMEGHDIFSLPCDPSPIAERHNACCREWDKLDYVLRPPEALAQSPREMHAENASTWMFPETFKQIDVRAFLLELCRTPEQIERVNQEMDLYEAKGLIPILHLMIYLVDHFRTQKAVWGVGRGSSVASYVLFLLGVHKIDSLRYDLDVSEFLK